MKDKFQITAGNLTGHGLSFAVSSFGGSKGELETALADAAEAIYRQGFEAARLSYDDRFDLGAAVETLRALSVIVGPIGAGERHRRAADAIAQLLVDQGG